MGTWFLYFYVALPLSILLLILIGLVYLVFKLIKWIQNRVNNHP
jgi:hypothetical protein